MTIAGGASMILLDEPTAGMSHSETEYAVALIRRVTQRKTLVMVEHDRSSSLLAASDHQILNSA
jgi:branched-chain amino acid transport system ATP-binding protein